MVVLESIEFIDSIVIGVIDYTEYPFQSYKKPDFTGQYFAMPYAVITNNVFRKSFIIYT